MSMDDSLFTVQTTTRHRARQQVQEGPPNPDLWPIILIPGIAGSKLIASSVRDPSQCEYAWVPNTVSVKKFCQSVVRNFWGVYQSGRFQSYEELYNYATIKPVNGINGCYRILDSGVTESSVASRLHICYYFDYYIDNLKRLGYIYGVNLFAFSYDWRQYPGSEINQKAFRDLIRFARSQNAGRKVSVIAHSMGGLITQAYMAQNPGDWHENIRRFAALSVPFDSSCGNALASYFEGFALGIPMPRNIGRGFQSVCPGITCLTPHDYENYDGTYEQQLNCCLPCIFTDQEFETPYLSNNYIQDSSFYSVRHLDQFVIFENPDSEIQKVILDYSVYRNQIPQVPFVILRHILQNNLVKHDLCNVIRSLQEACVKGAIITSENMYYSCMNTKFQTFKTEFRKIEAEEFQFGESKFEPLAAFDPLMEETNNLEFLSPQFTKAVTNVYNIFATQYQNDDIQMNHFVKYFFSERGVNPFLLKGKIEFPPEIMEFFKEGGFSRTISCNNNFAYKCAVINQMKEEYLTLKNYKIKSSYNIKELLSNEYIPGTLEDVLFSFNPEMVDYKQPTISYPQKCDYKFLSFAGAGIKTTFHCFKKNGRSKYSYADGDGLVLLPSALADCTPEEYVVDRTILPKMTHMNVKFQEDVFYKVYRFINDK